MISWLDPKPLPDPKLLTFPDLVDLWKAHRNDNLGRVAADEIVTRVVRKDPK